MKNAMKNHTIPTKLTSVQANCFSINILFTYTKMKKSISLFILFLLTLPLSQLKAWTVDYSLEAPTVNISYVDRNGDVVEIGNPQQDVYYIDYGTQLKISCCTLGPNDTYYGADKLLVYYDGKVNNYGWPSYNSNDMYLTITPSKVGTYEVYGVTTAYGSEGDTYYTPGFESEHITFQLDFFEDVDTNYLEAYYYHDKIGKSVDILNDADPYEVPVNNAITVSAYKPGFTNKTLFVRHGDDTTEYSAGYTTASFTPHEDGNYEVWMQAYNSDKDLTIETNHINFDIVRYLSVATPYVWVYNDDNGNSSKFTYNYGSCYSRRDVPTVIKLKSSNTETGYGTINAKYFHIEETSSLRYPSKKQEETIEASETGEAYFYPSIYGTYVITAIDANGYTAQPYYISCYMNETFSWTKVTSYLPPFTAAYGQTIFEEAGTYEVKLGDYVALKSNPWKTEDSDDKEKYFFDDIYYTIDGSSPMKVKFARPDYGSARLQILAPGTYEVWSANAETTSDHLTFTITLPKPTGAPQAPSVYPDNESSSVALSSGSTVTLRDTSGTITLRNLDDATRLHALYLPTGECFDVLLTTPSADAPQRLGNLGTIRKANDTSGSSCIFTPAIAGKYSFISENEKGLSEATTINVAILTPQQPTITFGDTDKEFGDTYVYDNNTTVKSGDSLVLHQGQTITITSNNAVEIAIKRPDATGYLISSMTLDEQAAQDATATEASLPNAYYRLTADQEGQYSIYLLQEDEEGTSYYTTPVTFTVTFDTKTYRRLDENYDFASASEDTIYVLGADWGPDGIGKLLSTYTNASFKTYDSLEQNGILPNGKQVADYTITSTDDQYLKFNLIKANTYNYTEQGYGILTTYYIKVANMVNDKGENYYFYFGPKGHFSLSDYDKTECIVTWDDGKINIQSTVDGTFFYFNPEERRFMFLYGRYITDDSTKPNIYIEEPEYTQIDKATVLYSGINKFTGDDEVWLRDSSTGKIFYLRDNVNGGKTCTYGYKDSTNTQLVELTPGMNIYNVKAQQLSTDDQYIYSGYLSTYSTSDGTSTASSDDIPYYTDITDPSLAGQIIKTTAIPVAYNDDDDSGTITSYTKTTYNVINHFSSVTVPFSSDSATTWWVGDDWTSDNDSETALAIGIVMPYTPNGDTYNNTPSLWLIAISKEVPTQINDIDSDITSLLEQPGTTVYTLSGLRVPTNNLTPGIYVVKPAQGAPRKIVISAR